jgi:hypothetical protein
MECSGVKPLSVRVPDEMMGEIEQAAAGERRTPSNLARNLLADALAVRSGRLAPSLESFVAEVREKFGGEAGDGFEAAFRAIDLEGDGVRDAAAFMLACEWIARHSDRSVSERLDAIDRLRRLKGHQVVNLREFTGWS